MELKNRGVNKEHRGMNWRMIACDNECIFEVRWLMLCVERERERNCEESNCEILLLLSVCLVLIEIMSGGE